jgi:DinB superfamily
MEHRRSREPSERLRAAIRVSGVVVRARVHQPLPSFDQDAAILQAGVEGRSWASHVDEFRAVRSATVPFFAQLPPEAWDRRGTASDNPFSVRALAYIIAGHVVHHAELLKERYL